MELYFERKALEEARYFSPTERKVRIVRRGLYFTYGVSPFRWCATVAALSLAFLNAKRLFLTDTLYEPLLVGASSTPAQTLSKAVYKSNLWIWDLFGTTADGRNLIFNILNFVNPRCRNHLGPQKVYYLGNYLPPEQIRVFLNGVEQRSLIEIESLIKLISEQYSFLMKLRGCIASEAGLNSNNTPPSLI